MDTIFYFDNLLLDFIQASMRFGVLDTAMPWITRFGNGGFIWIVAAILFICQRKYRAIGITILIALCASVLIGNIWLKPFIARLRPSDVDLEVLLLITRPTDFSFPSGHTLSSFAAAAAILWYNRQLGICAILLALIIAFSRLYLYVHYPSDIAGGILIGVGVGAASAFLYNTLLMRLKK